LKSQVKFHTFNNRRLIIHRITPKYENLEGLDAMPIHPEWKWIQWAGRLQAISQNGLHYAENAYDIERYQSIRQIAVEIMEAGSGAAQKKILDVFSDQAGHATPKVDVRGVVFTENKILLVKEKEDGGWTIPGGWADPDETPGEAAAREVFEESGFSVKPVRLLSVYDRTLHGHIPPHPFRIYKIFFLCDILGGEPKPSPETSDVAFFGQNEIPPLSLGRTTPSQINRFYEHLNRPDLPADFD
jgi:ADP-ribose pyrophosphatase YjhB (NUDIX family)